MTEVKLTIKPRHIPVQGNNRIWPSDIEQELWKGREIVGFINAKSNCEL